MNAAAAPKSLLAGLKSLGPYLLIELLLPGGTLIALLLWLFQNMTWSTRRAIHTPALPSPHCERTVMECAR